MINIKSFLNLNYYTSELDQFLAQYDKSHPKLSASQQKEIEKHNRIFEKRDTTLQKQPKKAIWDNF